MAEYEKKTLLDRARRAQKIGQEPGQVARFAKDATPSLQPRLIFALIATGTDSKKRSASWLLRLAPSVPGNSSRWFPKI